MKQNGENLGGRENKANKENRGDRENKANKTNGENKENKEIRKPTGDPSDAPALTDEEVGALLAILKERGESITTAESLTAGMISARLADIPGCSDVMGRAFVTYCDDAKHEMVKVKRKTLKKWTAVSGKCAKQMAKGGAKMSGAEACISATGYAGPPSGPEDKTVGLVYLGCFYRGKTSVEEHHYTGTRNDIRARAMNDALRLLGKMLKQ